MSKPGIKPAVFCHSFCFLERAKKLKRLKRLLKTGDVNEIYLGQEATKVSSSFYNIIEVLRDLWGQCISFASLLWLLVDLTHAPAQELSLDPQRRPLLYQSAMCPTYPQINTI